jgi:hypothetical protein
MVTIVIDDGAVKDLLEHPRELVFAVLLMDMMAPSDEMRTTIRELAQQVGSSPQTVERYLDWLDMHGVLLFHKAAGSSAVTVHMPRNRKLWLEGSALYPERRKRLKFVGATEVDEPEEEEDELTKQVANLADELYETLVAHDPGARRPKEAGMRHLEALLSTDGRSYEDVLAVIRWLRYTPDNDARFWSGVIVDARSLRKHFDKLLRRLNVNRKMYATTSRYAEEYGF